MQDDLKLGLVVRVTGREIWVDVGGATIACHPRGRFRKRSLQFAAGDRVRIALPGRPGDVGTIESREDRVNRLSRYVEREAGERVIVTNIEMLFVVAAVKTPPVHFEFIDRVLVAAGRGRVPARLVVNKIDLAGDDDGDHDRLTAVYSAVGYEVIATSAVTRAGVDDLAALVSTGVYAFVGESGVGKTSLLMELDPQLELAVREVGGKTGRGRHTTTYSQLYPFGRGYLADTPGVQTFGFAGDDPSELASCFPEFAAVEVDCRFSPCTHSHEPRCGVKSAVEDGSIPESRYQSYLNILAEVEERARRRTW